MNADNSQSCPGCGNSQRENLRYPGYFCVDCRQLTSDAGGRAVGFSNVNPKDALPGMTVAGFYRENNEPFSSEDCFVLGIPSRAREAHFGGVVIQPIAVWERTQMQ